MAPLLSARGLAVARGRRTLFASLDLEVHPGQAVALIGPNGVGKSTLLDCLSGVLAPQRGEVRLLGTALSQLSGQERARRMAFVPQKERPLFAYRVRELCSISRLAWNQAWSLSPQDEAEVGEALDRVGLGDLAEKSVLEISGGELQLALIARALAQQTPLLLLDEPTASLDLARHQTLRTILKDHKKGGGALLATHDINWALSVCDWLICLKPGEAFWQGRPSEAREPLEECFGVRLEWISTEAGPQALVKA